MNSMHGEVLEVLAETDRQTGTRLVTVMQRACSMFPNLLEVPVVPLQYVPPEAVKSLHLQDCPQASFSDSGDCMVTFGTEEGVYQSLIDGYLKRRFLPHKDFLQRSVGGVSVAAMIDTCVAHELGHAADMLNLREQLGVEDALSEFYRVVDEDMAALPLGMASTEALERWAANTGGYRTCLMNAGYTEDTFMIKLEENAEAYGYTRHEASADAFALAVLEQMYQDRVW